MDAQTLAEMIPALEAELARRRALVTVKDGVLTVRQAAGDPSGYDVPLRELRTAAGILRWTWHLSHKGWCSRDHMERFMEVAAAHARVELRLM